MLTECSPKQLAFERGDDHQMAADFDGSITSNARPLLLGEPNCNLGLIHRLPPAP